MASALATADDTLDPFSSPLLSPTEKVLALPTKTNESEPAKVTAGTKTREPKVEPVPPPASVAPMAPRVQTPQKVAAPTASDAAGLLRHFEGFREQPYWDVNHWRVGYGSDTVTHADGSIEPVTAMTRVTREDAERDLNRRVGISQRQVQAAIGPEAWARIPPNVQAALTSVVYNYGHLPKSLLAPVAAGDPAGIAAAIKSLPGQTNAGRRAQEAAFALGGAIPGGGGGIGGSVPLTQQNPAALLDPTVQQNAASPEPVAAKEEAPPPPEGFKLVSPGAAPPAEPPPPEGFKLVKSADDWYKEQTKNDFDTGGAPQLPPEQPTDAYFGAPKKPHESGFAAPFGSPENIENLKGAPAGAARDVTSAWSSLPNALGGGLAAEGTEYLNMIGSESGREAGSLLTALAPVGGAAKLLGVGEKAAETAPGLLNTAKSVARRVLGGGATGAAIGGATAPTTSQDWGDRLMDKLPAAATGAAMGVGLGGASEVFGGLSKVPSLFEKATTTAPEETAEALRKAAREEAANVARRQTETAAKAGEELASKRSELATHTGDVERIGEAQNQINTAVREYVRDAESHALKVGLSAEDARKFALGELEKVEFAKKSAADIAKAHLDRPALDEESIVAAGNDVQKTAKRIYDASVKRRGEEVGFQKVIDKAGSAPIVHTDDAIAYIDGAMKNEADSGVKAVLSRIKEELKAPGKETIREDARSRAEKLFAEATGKGKAEIVDEPQAINLAKADSVRKMIASAIQTKQIALASGDSKPVTSEAAHHLRAIYKRFYGDLKSASPEYDKAMGKFRELSRGLDDFERKGPLKNIIASDLMSHEFTSPQALVLGQLLDKSRQGYPVVARLVKEQPELKDAIASYFNRKLFGFGGARYAPTQKKLDTFLAENARALKETGLYKDFATLSEARKTADGLVKRAEDAAKSAEEAAKVKETAHAEALAKVAEAKKTAAESAKKLDKPAAIARQNARDTQKAIDKLAETKAKAEKLTRLSGGVDTKLEKASPAEMPAIMKQFGDDLFKKGYIDKDKLGEFIDHANDVEKKFKDRKEAENHMKQLRFWLLGTVAGTVAGEWGIHHLRRMAL